MDICTERVNDLLLTAADMCIPTFTVRKKINPPWITKDILNNIKKKKGYGENLKLIHQKPLEESLNSYQDQSNSL